MAIPLPQQRSLPNERAALASQSPSQVCHREERSDAAIPLPQQHSLPNERAALASQSPFRPNWVRERRSALT